MKNAITTLLILSCSVTGVALAQDGNGHGPPKRSSVVFLAQATGSSETGNLSKLFQVKSILAPAK